MKTAIVLALFSLFTDVALADKVDDFVRAEMKRRQVPGLSIAVLKQGKVLKVKGYGYANVELNVPASPETVYQLASITKCFTATAVMQLVGDGKLALEDQITTRLPGLPAAWSEITVKHLLTHTSGIKNYTELAAIGDDPQKEFTNSGMIALVAQLPLEFRPGERFSYSNTGYYLLGMIIEKVSGTSYGDFLTTRIFKPAGMAATRVNSYSDLIPGRAAGYVLRESTIFNGIFVNPSQPFAAGALVTSVSDLAKWDAALYTEKLLQRSTLESMWAPTKLNDNSLTNYGLGWGIRETPGRKWVQHNGGIIGFSSHMRRGLDDGLTVIVLANQSGRGVYAEEIAGDIAVFFQGKN
jgi:CubicO group peptidase (beta-lactamase class C family)